MRHLIHLAASHGAKSRFSGAGIGWHTRAAQGSRAARSKATGINASLWIVLLGCTNALLTVSVPQACAGPMGFQSIPDLTGKATAIVVASVQATLVNGMTNAMVNPEQVLKGPLTPGNLISITWSSPGPGVALPGPYSARPSSGHGILFLKQSDTGVWSLLPSAGGDIGWNDTYIHTPSTLPPGRRDVVSATLPTNASVLDKVLVEMVIAEEAGAPTPFDLVAIFRQSQSKVLMAAFTRFLANQNPRLTILGLRGSTASGDVSAILKVYQDYSALASAKFWPSLVEEIRLYYTNSTSRSVQTLGQIATDTKTGLDLRIAAAVALARIHTQQSLPYLAQLLADPNLSLKSAAVGGMASFANNVPIGSHEPASGTWPYRTDDTIAHSAFDENLVTKQESYYVGFWQAWWQKNQSGLAQ
jgi:hypothetical protein